MRRNLLKERRLKVARKMAAMRAAKERKRLACPAPQREPKLEQWHPLELGLRDKSTGEVAWCDLVSLRDATRRLAVVLREYKPGIPTWPILLT